MRTKPRSTISSLKLRGSDLIVSAIKDQTKLLTVPDEGQILVSDQGYTLEMWNSV